MTRNAGKNFSLLLNFHQKDDLENNTTTGKEISDIIKNISNKKLAVKTDKPRFLRNILK